MTGRTSKKIPLFLAMILPALLIFVSSAPAQNESESVEKRISPFKKRFLDVPIGPFRLDLGANVRLRHEYQAEYGLRGYEPGTNDHFLLARIMLDLNLKLTSDSRLFIQFRDARALGTHFTREDFRGSNPIEDFWDIRQAYFEWKGIGSSPVGAKVGRQQISYGDQRIFGPGLWGNTGRYTWDAAMVRIDTTRVWIDGWVGRPVKNLPFTLELFYAGKYDTGARTEGESGIGNLHSHSLGFQLEKPPEKGLDYKGSFIVQTGRYGRDRIRAFGVNAGLGVTVPVKWNPRLAAQFTWGSGDRNPRDGIHGTFDGVFGGADINFYGDLNLFFWANLRDYEFDLHLRPTPKIQLMVENHYFTLDQARDAWYTTGMAPLRRDKNGLSGKALGNEFNIRLSWRPAGWLELLAGWGFFSPGGFVKETGPADNAYGYFLQAAYSL